MTALREFVAAVRCAQTALAARWCAYDLERARIRLARALDAHDHAVADYRAHHSVAPDPVPLYVAKRREG